MKKKILKFILLLVLITGISVWLIYELLVGNYDRPQELGLLWAEGLFFGYYARKWFAEAKQAIKSNFPNPKKLHNKIKKQQQR